MSTENQTQQIADTFESRFKHEIEQNTSCKRHGGYPHEDSCYNTDVLKPICPLLEKLKAKTQELKEMPTEATLTQILVIRISEEADEAISAIAVPRPFSGVGMEELYKVFRDIILLKRALEKVAAKVPLIIQHDERAHEIAMLTIECIQILFDAFNKNHLTRLRTMPDMTLNQIVHQFTLDRFVIPPQENKLPQTYEKSDDNDKCVLTNQDSILNRRARPLGGVSLQSL